MQYKISSSWYRLFIFIIGIIATFAYRVIVVLNHYSAVWVQIAWYVGTIGFIWYFAHRFRVERDYARIVNDRKLDEKVRKNKLSEADREALIFVLSGMHSSKAKWNSIFIFIFSAIALIYAIVTDIANLIAR